MNSRCESVAVHWFRFREQNYEDDSRTNNGHRLTQDVRRWRGKDTPPSPHVPAGPQDYLVGTSGSSDWIDIARIPVNRLGHKPSPPDVNSRGSGSEVRSWKKFTSRFHPHVSQPSSTIFEWVGTPSRRLESGARFGETLRAGTHPTNSQRYISLNKGDRG